MKFLPESERDEFIRKEIAGGNEEKMALYTKEVMTKAVKIFIQNCEDPSILSGICHELRKDCRLAFNASYIKPVRMPQEIFNYFRALTLNEWIIFTAEHTDSAAELLIFVEAHILKLLERVEVVLQETRRDRDTALIKAKSVENEIAELKSVIKANEQKLLLLKEEKEQREHRNSQEHKEHKEHKVQKEQPHSHAGLHLEVKDLSFQLRELRAQVNGLKNMMLQSYDAIRAPHASSQFSTTDKSAKYDASKFDKESNMKSGKELNNHTQNKGLFNLNNNANNRSFVHHANMKRNQLSSRNLDLVKIKHEVTKVLDAAIQSSPVFSRRSTDIKPQQYKVTQDPSSSPAVSLELDELTGEDLQETLEEFESHETFEDFEPFTERLAFKKVR